MMTRTGRTADWWRGCAIYQVYPRSFQDTTGDGSGDLKGVTQRLGHIASLGVDAVWLSPFFKSPMADMGYDVSDYRAVDPMFGTLEDFDALVAEAHRHGLKVIIDQVLSHSSDQHPWFIESRASRDQPKADWYVWADAKPDGTRAEQLAVGVRRPGLGMGFRRAGSTTCTISWPRSRTSTSTIREVQEALLDAVRFWLDRGVDGFRLDTVNYYVHDRWLRDNPPLAESVAGTIDETNPYLFQSHLFDKTQPENLDFLKRFRALLDEYEARASVGEVGDEDRSLQTVAAYTRRRRQAAHVLHVRPARAAILGRPCARLRRGLRGGRRRRLGLLGLLQPRRGAPCLALDAAGRATPTRSRKFAIALLACLRGSICLYQGEELGLTEAEIAFEDLRDPYRHPLLAGLQGQGRLPHADGLGSGGSRMPVSRRQSPGCRYRRSTGHARWTSRRLSRTRCSRATARCWRFGRTIRRCGWARSPSSTRRRTCWRSGATANDERLICAFNFGARSPSNGRCRPASARWRCCSTVRAAQCTTRWNCRHWACWLVGRSADSRKKCAKSTAHPAAFQS